MKSEARKVKSWDFWDTLFTRKVFPPTALFEVMEKKTGITGFKEKRVKAEISSRKGVKETTIQRIYDNLDFNEDRKNSLIELEKDLEVKFSQPIKENIDEFNVDDVILSDMYLPKDVFVRILNKWDVQFKEENIYISCEHQATKSGKGLLFTKALSKHPIKYHIGDNYISDYENAIIHGIKAVHFSSSSLSEFESSWFFSNSPDARFYAGLIRSLRLSNNIDKKHQLFAEVLSPVLLEFVKWVLRKAEKNKVKKIFFLARDGQLPFKIAKELLKKSKYKPEIHYVYASRNALRLPGHIDFDESAKWLFESTPTFCLKTISQRSSIDLKYLESILDMTNEESLNIKLNERANYLKNKLLNNETFRSKLEFCSLQKFKAASEYFKKVGMFCEDIAIVDVGWNGTMQLSVENIRKKAGIENHKVKGFYFGLNKRAYIDDGKRAYGFCRDIFRGKNINMWIENYCPVIESCLEADHGSTKEYAINEGKIEVIFSKYPESRLPLIRDRHRIVTRFAKKYVDLCDEIKRELVDDQYLSVNNFRLLLTYPTKLESEAFLGTSFSEEQIEENFAPLVKEIKNPLTTNPFKKASTGIWPNASYSYSRILAYYIIANYLRQIFRFLKKTIKPVRKL